MLALMMATNLCWAKQVKTWNDPNGGRFLDGSNWNGGTPTASQIANFNLDSQYDVTWNASDPNTATGQLLLNRGVVNFFASSGVTKQHTTGDLTLTMLGTTGTNPVPTLRIGNNVSQRFDLVAGTATLKEGRVNISPSSSFIVNGDLRSDNGRIGMESGSRLTVRNSWIHRGLETFLSGSSSSFDGATVNVAGEFQITSTEVSTTSFRIVNGTEVDVGGRFATAGNVEFLMRSGSGLTANWVLVSFDSAVVATDSTLTANDLLFVSNAGRLTMENSNLDVGGLLDIEGSVSLVSTTGLIGGSVELTNGSLSVGASQLTVNGNLSSIDGSDITIANGGVVNSDSALLGSSSSTVVQGNGSAWNLSNSLEMLGGTLETADGGTLAVGGSATIGNNSILNLNGGLFSVGGTTTLGDGASVNINGGRFEFDQLSMQDYGKVTRNSGSAQGVVTHNDFTDVSSLPQARSAFDATGVVLQNSGVFYGTGILSESLQNTSTGEIETATGERMRFAGNGTNAGEFNNFGGVIRFDGSLVNEAGGLIGGRGQFTFNGGLENAGVIATSGGFADFHGDVANTSTGRIVIGGNSVTTFFDDVTMDATNLNITVADNSTAVFFGSYNGGNDGTGAVQVFGDLRPGNSPASVNFGGDLTLGVDTTTFIELAGTLRNQFDQLFVSGDLELNGLLNVDLLGSFALDFGQEFLIVDIAGTRSGVFSNFGEGDLVGTYGGKDLFLTYAAGNGNDIGLFTAVPEPGSLVLFGGLGCLLCMGRRRKRI